MKAGSLFSGFRYGSLCQFSLCFVMFIMCQFSQFFRYLPVFVVSLWSQRTSFRHVRYVPYVPVSVMCQFSLHRYYNGLITSPSKEEREEYIKCIAK